jgi:hypothetical protein
LRKLAIASDVLPIKFADIGFVDENGVRWRGFEMTNSKLI